MIDAGYPVADQLIKNERKTLEFLINDRAVNNDFPILSMEAKNAFYGGLPEVFAFESHIDLVVERRPRRIHIGAEIKAKKKHYEKVSYYFAFCEEAKSSGKFLRKFHFDYVSAHERATQLSSKPVFHLQYCGTMSPKLGGLGFKDDHMDPWLSVPRIPSTPMTLALLLNAILVEFKTDEVLHRFVQRKEWRGIVRANETMLLLPYFESCSRYVKIDRDLLTTNFYYGMS